MEEFIGKSFWYFFNELPTFRRKKELQCITDGKATLLVTNGKSGEQYNVVCSCNHHFIYAYSFKEGCYVEFGDIVSITKV